MAGSPACIPADLQKCINDLSQRRSINGSRSRWSTAYGVMTASTDGSPTPEFRGFCSDGSFVGYIGCCVDVDDQKQAELARTELSRRLMTAQEAERTRIARELHDGIGQALALLGIQMQTRQSTGCPARREEKSRTAGTVRKVKGNRQPGKPAFPSTAFFGTGVSRPGGSRERACAASSPNNIASKLIVSATTFQKNWTTMSRCVFSESCRKRSHNVAKHSQASVVYVEVRGAAHELSLAISDDGIGFDMNKVRKTAGLGMVSMRERMHLIGGEFVISSKPGSGTKIQAKAPLAIHRH